MWGFVSIMLVFLFMFMPATTDTHTLVSVDLAPTYHATPMSGARRENAILVSLASDGTIYFRDQRIGLAELAPEIQKSVRDGAEKRIYFKVDARAKYGSTKRVLEQIQLLGIEKVSFLTLHMPDFDVNEERAVP